MTLRIKYFLQLLVLFGLLTPALAVLATPRVDIAPAPTWRLPVKAGGRVPLPKEFTEGYYVALVDLQTHVELQAHYSHLIREIKTTEGVQNGSQISVYFNPAFERLAFHNVTLYRGGKPISKLKAGAFKIAPIEAERDRFIYNDSYIATLLLDDVRPGDRIDYDYTITGTNPVFGGRFANDFYFSSADLLPHRHQVLLVSPGRKLTLRSLNNPPKPQISSQNGLKLYEWDAYNLKSPLKEPYEPEWNDREAHVQVSEYGSWQDVVNWALPMYTVQPASAPLLTLISEWKKQAKGNALAYAQLATAFVQNDVRYMGIEIGEYSHRPHNPAQVINQRYGDCKDKSLLLCTLLQANQTDAYPALTSTYAGPQMNQSLPGPTVFNHAIVWMQVSGITYWIDPTISHQGNADGMFRVPSYGAALVLKPGETALRPVISSKRGTIDVTETFIIPPPRTPEALSKLRVVSIYSANHADNMRAQLAAASLSTLEKSYLDFYQGNYKRHQVELLDSLRIEDDLRSNTLMSYEGYSLANTWEMDSTSGVATFGVFGRTFYNNLHQLTAEKRHQPLALPFPFEMDYTIQLELPEAWSAVDDQWAIKRDGYELSFDRFYDPADSTLRLHYHYKTLAEHLPAETVDTYRADVKKITDELEYQLSYNGKLDGQGGHIHPGSVIFFLLALLGFAYMGWRWYQYSPLPTSDSNTSRSIGGWLLLMAFSVLLSPFVLAYQFITTPAYWNASTWATLKDAETLKTALLHISVYLEGVLNLGLFCFSVLCAILFVQKRSTFPLLYSVFLASRIVVLIVDTVVFGEVFDIKIDDHEYGELGRSIIILAIWIPYLNKSTRVRQTFVIPYLNRLIDNDYGELHYTGTEASIANSEETDAIDPKTSME
ncbi:DUF3857 domain-containing protein [Spirosoma foliorum]|uniref:DUF3857 domain-containing protein n=1 Tax=Spirosoma foliorum TaxID=2710596 RepID=A0A7G5H230_9BACT|nr:DUF3857 domain-containing protein [Spirosoma foliorum]QMW05172.1 DUF3857 domain-containing protein [Spirosoma foliorum]